MRRLDRLRSVKNRMVRLNKRVETVRSRFEAFWPSVLGMNMQPWRGAHACCPVFDLFAFA